MGELDGFEAFYAAAYRRVVGQVFALLGDLQEAWEVTSGNRPVLRVRDLARGSEHVLPVPGPLSGPRIISRGSW